MADYGSSSSGSTNSRHETRHRSRKLHMGEISNTVPEKRVRRELDSHEDEEGADVVCLGEKRINPEVKEEVKEEEISDEDAAEEDYESDPDPAEHYSGVVDLIMGGMFPGMYESDDDDDWGYGFQRRRAYNGPRFFGYDHEEERRTVTVDKTVDPFALAAEREKKKETEGVLVVTTDKAPNNVSAGCTIVRVWEKQDFEELDALATHKFHLIYLQCKGIRGQARDLIQEKIGRITAEKLVIRDTHVTKEVFSSLIRNKKEVVIENEVTSMFSTAYEDTVIDMYKKAGGLRRFLTPIGNGRVAYSLWRGFENNRQLRCEVEGSSAEYHMDEGRFHLVWDGKHLEVKRDD